MSKKQGNNSEGSDTELQMMGNILLALIILKIVKLRVV